MSINSPAGHLSLKAEGELPLSAIMILLYLHRLLSAAHHKWIFCWQYQGKPGWAELWSHNRLCCVQSRPGMGNRGVGLGSSQPFNKTSIWGFDSSKGFSVTDLCSLHYWQGRTKLFFFVGYWGYREMVFVTQHEHSRILINILFLADFCFSFLRGKLWLNTTILYTASYVHNQLWRPVIQAHITLLSSVVRGYSVNIS